MYPVLRRAAAATQELLQRRELVACVLFRVPARDPSRRCGEGGARVAPLKRPLDARPFQLSRRRPRAHGRGCRYSGARHRRNRPSSLSRRFLGFSRCQTSERCVTENLLKRAAREAAGDAVLRLSLASTLEFPTRARGRCRLLALSNVCMGVLRSFKTEIRDAGPHVNVQLPLQNFSCG